MFRPGPLGPSDSQMFAHSRHRKCPGALAADTETLARRVRDLPARVVRAAAPLC